MSRFRRWRLREGVEKRRQENAARETKASGNNTTCTFTFSCWDFVRLQCMKVCIGIHSQLGLARHLFTQGIVRVQFCMHPDKWFCPVLDGTLCWSAGDRKKAIFAVRT